MAIPAALPLVAAGLVASAASRRARRRRAREALDPSPDALDRTRWEPGQPVDAVVLWVDPSDPTWRRARSRFRPDAPQVDTSAARWQNADEIRYALRGLHHHAPWLRRIHLVTAFGQVPRWLDLDAAADARPQLRLVDHTRILPEDVLPTFNSCAIESGLHRIPGLAPWFLYANDDTHVGRPMRPQHLFDTDGRGRMFRQLLTTQVPLRISPLIDTGFFQFWDQLAENQRVTTRLFGPRMRPWPRHHARLLCTEVLGALEDWAPEVWRTVERARFRTPRTVSPTFLAEHAAVEVGASRYARAPSELFLGIGDDPRRNRRALDRLVRERPLLYCVNDASSGPDAARVGMLREALEAVHPVPLPYER